MATATPLQVVAASFKIRSVRKGVKYWPAYRCSFSNDARTAPCTKYSYCLLSDKHHLDGEGGSADHQSSKMHKRQITTANKQTKQQQQKWDRLVFNRKRTKQATTSTDDLKTRWHPQTTNWAKLMEEESSTAHVLFGHKMMNREVFVPAASSWFDFSSDGQAPLDHWASCESRAAEQETPNVSAQAEEAHGQDGHSPCGQASPADKQKQNKLSKHFKLKLDHRHELPVKRWKK